MSNEDHLISHEGQFRFKEEGRRMAATATFEEKVVKLIQLQKISSELARQAGLPVRQPWNIQLSSK
jgi:hypothetical protein